MSVDRARLMVDSALAMQGEDLSKLDVKNQSTETRPHRLDHGFTYEAREGDPRNVAEAKYRRNGGVDGNWLHVVKPPWYKIPETWEREREAGTVLRTVKSTLTFLVIAALVVWAVGVLAYRMRRGFVPWRRALLYAAIPAVVAFLAGTNEFYLSKATYFNMVATPWSVFRTGVITQWLISTGVLYVFFAVGLAVLSALYPEAAPALRRPERRAAGLDAGFTILGGIGALLLAKDISMLLAAANPAWIPFEGWTIPEWLSAPMPLLLMLGSGLSRTLVSALLLAFFAYLWEGRMRTPLLRAVLLLAAVVMVMPTSSPDANEWLYSLLTNIVRVALAFVVLRYLVAGRPVLLLALAAGLTIYSLAAQGLGTGNGFVIANTWGFVVIAIAALGVWVGGAGRKIRDRRLET
ncbi:MAG TPA: hypothetical protein VGL38_13360 [bacterium]